MDLQTIIDNTPLIIEKGAAIGTITYPLYTGIKSIMSKERFTDVFVKKDTMYMVSAIAAGSILSDYASLLLK